MKKKLKTIKVTGGGDYAKVTERLKEFHKTFEKGKIKTSYNLTQTMICFKAKVTPDIEQPERYFTGHSLGEVGGHKAFEKLETVAVGRALAFLGLLADGDIASFEEMQEYEKIETPTGKKVSIQAIIKKMKELTDIKELEENKEKIKESELYTDVQKNVVIRAINEKITELQANV